MDTSESRVLEIDGPDGGTNKVLVVGTGIATADRARLMASLCEHRANQVLVVGPDIETLDRAMLMEDLRRSQPIPFWEIKAPPPLHPGENQKWEKRPRPYKECLLDGCEVQTNHRGGYCCVQHCKQARV